MSQISPSDIRPHLERDGSYHWTIEFEGAECKFESQEPEIGVLYHLFVPEEQRGCGIGSSMVDVAVRTLRNEGVSEIHSQIGASNGATNHIFATAGFETMDFTKTDSDQTIIDGVLRLD